MSLDRVRAIADAVLYEGYLLYPYRASSSKNQSRWQFGVLGPPHASAASFAEEPGMSMQCLLDQRDADATATIHVRFLHLQERQVLQRDSAGRDRPVAELVVDGTSWLSWDEAVEHEVTVTAVPLDRPIERLLEVEGGADAEDIEDAQGAVVGQVVRRRLPLLARLRTSTETDDGLVRLSIAVANEHPDPVSSKDAAIRRSLIGAHVVLSARGADFVSVLEPPDGAVGAASRCAQCRCWPVLAGAVGDTDVLLGAPIILYDYPEVAEQSREALYDATEIDEILTLRVMTLTDEEKAEARATDPRARRIIDRCDTMTDADLQRLHGVLRDPHAVAVGGSPDVRELEPPDFESGDVPWWDPEADAAVAPETDSVMVDGVPVRKGSLVRVHPSRRADAQDLFFAEQVARVTGVLSDVDGEVHVALVLLDDPAADLHDWYGRYFYFAPEEIEPLPDDVSLSKDDDKEESRS